MSLGCGGGQVVSVLAFYSDDPSSNPAVNFCKIVIEKNENKQKRGRGWPIFNKKNYLNVWIFDLLVQSMNDNSQYKIIT